ncbi:MULTISPECIES: YitT family protein [Hymenobacter]|uniref:YitT family protein n=2 Tax=Hymenobacter TaxID=89966 RepID=A0ABR7MMZ5_9BACT|nr:MULTISPECIES: YitT family protein [Hymenobacter]MBC6612459.1 YitT family protein [Hymenobacter citatus]MBO3272247.1 YitT family protein [Hymenobacter defluvii]
MSQHSTTPPLTGVSTPAPAPSPTSIFTRLKSLGFILLGILSAGMGLKGFLLSSHFIDGGATGISMLLSAGLGLPLSWGLLLINLPFLLLGYRQMGLRFALKSAAAIAGLALCLVVIPYPDLTPDLLLTSVFGGVFIGAGIGLAMRGGAVLDGTEILALLINRSTPLLKVSDIILVVNVFIFGVAAFILGLTEALYSILTYVAASKTLDFILTGIEQYTGVTIISENNEAIRETITAHLGRGVTIYKGQSGYGKRGQQREERNIIFTVVTRLELPGLREEVKRLDPHAFIVQHSVDDAVGGMLKRRPLH